jgi:hypothetical protein
MSDTTSASASEFVEQLLVLAKAEHVNSDAVSKLVNRFVRSIDVEKKEEKKAKKEAKKDAKKNGKKEKSELDKPDNVYILYCREKRKSITDLPENKGKRPEAITCLLADEWRKERAQNSSFIKGLQQKADEASLKYKMAKARAKEEKEAKENPEKGEKKKKREPSAYNIFYSQMMAQMKEEGMDATHIPKAITDKWNTMSAEEKNAFKGKALTPKKTKAEKAPDAPKKAKPEKKDKKAPKQGGEDPKQEDPKRELDFSGQ